MVIIISSLCGCSDLLPYVALCCLMLSHVVSCCLMLSYVVLLMLLCDVMVEFWGIDEAPVQCSRDLGRFYRYHPMHVM